MAEQRFVVAACGLAAEARCAERSANVRGIAGGGREPRLRELLNEAVAAGASGIVSFGIAGALDPELRPGDIVIGEAVKVGDEIYRCDATWTANLRRALQAARTGNVSGSSVVVATPAAKAALYNSTSTIVADMESHFAASLARAHGLPFVVLRAVADRSDQTLPPAAISGLKADGTPDIAAVLKSLAGNPAQFGDLMRAALASRRAMAALFRCHRLLGPGLGFADLG